MQNIDRIHGQLRESLGKRLVQRIYQHFRDLWGVQDDEQCRTFGLPTEGEFVSRIERLKSQRNGMAMRYMLCLTTEHVQVFARLDTLGGDCLPTLSKTDWMELKALGSSDAIVLAHEAILRAVARWVWETPPPDMEPLLREKSPGATGATAGGNGESEGGQEGDEETTQEGEERGRETVGGSSKRTLRMRAASGSGGASGSGTGASASAAAVSGAAVSAGVGVAVGRSAVKDGRKCRNECDEISSIDSSQGVLCGSASRRNPTSLLCRPHISDRHHRPAPPGRPNAQERRSLRPGIQVGRRWTPTRGRT